MKICTTLGYIVHIFIVKMFHQEASVETIKLVLNKCNLHKTFYLLYQYYVNYAMLLIQIVKSSSVLNKILVITFEFCSCFNFSPKKQFDKKPEVVFPQKNINPNLGISHLGHSILTTKSRGDGVPCPGLSYTGSIPCVERLFKNYYL